jgi:hypothetical protein
MNKNALLQTEMQPNSHTGEIISPKERLLSVDEKLSFQFLNHMFRGYFCFLSHLFLHVFIHFKHVPGYLSFSFKLIPMEKDETVLLILSNNA